MNVIQSSRQAGCQAATSFRTTCEQSKRCLASHASNAPLLEQDWFRYAKPLLWQVRTLPRGVAIGARWFTVPSLFWLQGKEEDAVVRSPEVRELSPTWKVTPWIVQQQRHQMDGCTEPSMPNNTK